MTKQLGKSPIYSEFGERYESIAREYRKALKRTEDALTFKGLSISEAYIEGRLRIAIQYRSHSSPKFKGSTILAMVGNIQREVSETLPSGIAKRIDDQQLTVDCHPAVCRDQDEMLGLPPTRRVNRFLGLGWGRIALVLSET